MDQLIQHLMQATTAKAERLGFCTASARSFVLRYLTENGPSWGEAVVEAATNQGRPELIAHDGRAWGSVFATLSKRNAIVCLRADGIRKCGNGATGARQWALAH